jgi:hypothetical protein
MSFSIESVRFPHKKGEATALPQTLKTFRRLEDKLGSELDVATSITKAENGTGVDFGTTIVN